MSQIHRFVGLSPAWLCIALLSALPLGAQALPGASHPKSQDVPEACRQQIRTAYGQLPLSFEANQGQADRRVQFLSRGSGYSLFLTRREAVLTLKSGPDDRGAALRMKLAGSRHRPQVTGMNRLPGTANYFIGADAAQWHTGIATYRKVNYRGVYPGIDLTYYGNQKQLEYDFVVAPGGDPKAIALEFQGADALEIDSDGDLVLHVAGRQVRERKPVVYQEIEGARKAVEGRYVLSGQRQVRFQIAGYDRSRALIIDPTLAYSTYLGGSAGDSGNGIAVDSNGNAYVTGNTFSSNFPTTVGAGFGGVDDAFVTRLNATGTALVYSTYVGGSQSDEPFGIAVDSSFNAYVIGATNSTDFPTTMSAYQTTFGGDEDAFVTKLNAAGGLVYSTYLGGSSQDVGNGIAVDSNGNAYVTGLTTGNFPSTMSAYQTTFGGNQDAFVTKLNALGTALLYSTYLGGSGDDSGRGIAVDSSFNAYVTGHTTGNFPTTMSAYQTTFGGNEDAFVTKLNPAGSALLYSTYLGGSSQDAGNGIAVDSNGNTYVAGGTSGNFPTTLGAYQTTYGGNQDAFVTELNPAGSALLYSTYLGGSNTDVGYGIAVDMNGDAYVTGLTASANFPTTPGAYQTTYGDADDAFVTKLNPAGSALLYSTYLGGSNTDVGYGIAVDSNGNAYVTGNSFSSNFPTTAGAYQTTFGGSYDAFVAKFSLQPDLTATKTNSVMGTTPLGNNWTWTITVANVGPNFGTFANNATILTDNLPNSNISYGATVTVTPVSGITGTINCSIVTSNLSCTASGSVSIAATGSFTAAFTATPSSVGVFANPRNLGMCMVDPNAVVSPAESNVNNNACSDSVTVSAASTTTTAANAMAPFSTTDQNVTLTATVTSPAGTVNEGTVTFTVSGVGAPVTVNVVNGTASANFTLPGNTPPDMYTIQAAYSGTSNFIPSGDSTHTLTVNCGPANTPMVTLNPVSLMLNAGDTATFTAAASSSPAPTVQWQVSTDGGKTWTPIAGGIYTINTTNPTANATSTTLSFVVTAAMNGNHYQAVFTNTCAVVPTDPAVTLTVHPPGNSFLIRYSSNLNRGDSFVDVSNDGSVITTAAVPSTGPVNYSTGNICVNVYAFDPAEEMVSCCACLVTPNALASLSVNSDLIGNTLTPASPSAVVIKLLATVPAISGQNPLAATQTCDPSLPNGLAATPIAPALHAWGTTLHAQPGGAFGATETAFSQAALGIVNAAGGFTPQQSELQRITSNCGFIQTNGSGFGICKSCRADGLGAAKQ